MRDRLHVRTFGLEELVDLCGSKASDKLLGHGVLKCQTWGDMGRAGRKGKGGGVGDCDNSRWGACPLA